MNEMNKYELFALSQILTKLLIVCYECIPPYNVYGQASMSFSQQAYRTMHVIPPNKRTIPKIGPGIIYMR